jgi:hypothetical protein
MSGEGLQGAMWAVQAQLQAQAGVVAVVVVACADVTVVVTGRVPHCCCLTLQQLGVGQAVGGRQLVVLTQVLGRSLLLVVVVVLMRGEVLMRVVSLPLRTLTQCVGVVCLYLSCHIWGHHTGHLVHRTVLHLGGHSGCTVVDHELGVLKRCGVQQLRVTHWPYPSAPY